ncbi:type III secretion system outer membrane ring subunit SctC [Aquabacterium sp.]|uniref:type III secretion system outer membrane ring subunit SctC n=1 Tax=Aquabacterium sp. TaxID=1872578 RepID=UPI002D1B2148|nr:type III secretion system outer membrane ring subunit SctC [Aquabacterium sp.]HSW05257.1 type III secretion system outer membrane ring subunit SctC [Aquabacterium sp.]
MFTTLVSGVRRAALGLFVGSMIAATALQPAQAGAMPNGSRSVSITAREQPIGAFLQDLFAAVDVPVTLGPGLTGSVNGSFTGPAEKVLRDVARVYNLVSYYDGAVMHVVPAADMVRRSFTASPAVADRVLREAGELGLPDARNTLRRSGEGNMLAVGTRRFVEQLDEMMRATQVAPAAAAPGAGAIDFRVFYLRYAWAQDQTMTFGGRQVLLPGVASILRSLVGARPGAPLGQEVMLRPTQPSLRGQGLASQGTPVKTAGGNNRESAADLLVAALARTAQPAEPQPTIAADPNQVRIEADPRLNAVIVRDLADRLPRYEQLIAALDVEPQSLEIEATIIDVNTDKMRELGVDWRFNNAGNSLGFGGNVPVTGAGGVVTAVLGSVGQFVSRIRALQAEGAARVVSSPQVVTLSNVEALFDNSSTFFVRVAGRDEVDLFNVSAGTSLRVTPHVFKDRDNTRIKLMVQVEDGNITGRTVDQIPVVERSTINTQALIMEGESLLIGGMTRDSTSSSVDKVPGLGDIPVVGNLFKTRTNSSARIERMFLITPRLAATRPATSPAALQTTAAPAAGPAAATGRAPSPAPLSAPAPAPSPAPAPVPTPLLQTAAASPNAPQARAIAQAPAAAPPVYAPPARSSVVLDLDAMPGPAAARPAAFTPGAVNARPSAARTGKTTP